MKMPTIVGIFICISRENFVLSLVDHEKSFITSGPDQTGRIRRLICFSLWKHTYSNILKILSQKQKKKTENFQIKNSDIFHISAQNIDCGYSLELPKWGSSNEYPQSMFLCGNKKKYVSPCKPQFYYMEVGFTWVKII